MRAWLVSASPPRFISHHAPSCPFFFMVNVCWSPSTHSLSQAVLSSLLLECLPTPLRPLLLGLSLRIHITSRSRSLAPGSRIRQSFPLNWMVPPSNVPWWFPVISSTTCSARFYWPLSFREILGFSPWRLGMCPISGYPGSIALCMGFFFFCVIFSS
jgi:hypothetical protein